MHNSFIYLYIYLNDAKVYAATHLYQVPATPYSLRIPILNYLILYYTILYYIYKKIYRPFLVVKVDSIDDPRLPFVCPVFLQGTPCTFQFLSRFQVNGPLSFSGALLVRTMRTLRSVNKHLLMGPLTPSTFKHGNVFRC